MSMADRDGVIWYDGKLVPWREANTHVLTHTLHYGMGVFEGVRAYETDKGAAIFRLQDHTDRLFRSAKIVGMKGNVVTFSKNSAQLAALFAQDEIWAAPVARFTWSQMLKTGLPLKWSIPAEGQAAGMNVMGLALARVDGRPIDFLTAIVHLVLFWIGNALLTPFIVLVGLFTDRGRLLHDLLLGTVVVRRDRY